MRLTLLRLPSTLLPRNPSRPIQFLRMASHASAFGLKDHTLVKTQAFIGGKWLDAKSGEKIVVQNPATLEELGTVPEMGLAETKEAIDAASKALPEWSNTTAKVSLRPSDHGPSSNPAGLTKQYANNLFCLLQHRHDILMKMFALMQEHHEDLARLITLENGKTLTEAKGENTYSASFLEWFAGEAVRTYGEHIPSAIQNVRNITIKQPIGVVTRKLGAALAAGCTSVIKPPPETPFSCLALVELARRAGVPDGVINVVTTQKNVAEVGKEMCESKIVKKVTFTGSTPVAKLLAGMAASTLKKPGGNAAFIVFDDADIDEAVAAAIICKFRGTGQTCVCANRIFVQSSVYAEFASRLAEKVATFKVGNGLDSSTTHGPLIHARAVEKVKAHVDDAVALGAQVLVGGKHVPGTSFFNPTVLCDVPVTARINNEETFGPLAALIKFETEDEVIKLANSTDVGLAGVLLFARCGTRVARRGEAGSRNQAVIPFGGIKESGLGREGSHGIEEYMNTKLIVFGGLA
ncbi:Succinate-semialdehyde dehydrogenase [Mycena sanguinolenta]|uniref:Succinate-semialdehyde dehydrogenase n=1 Tax=Mycena sanguinolenta TaxID=230812 RepID=A0A8H6TX75_9AGAR|nr:Succinate-semialdehyde dehydrogenase [Mycena sanguinolenta]